MATRPCIALLEFGSVADGIVAGDAMAKRAPITALYTGTVQPGHYLVLVGGEVAAVEEAVSAGREASAESLLDLVILPDVHPAVIEAVRGVRVEGNVEALGIIETTTVAAILEAADAGVKGADVDLLELYPADGLGGKAYLLFGGLLPDVEASVAIGSGRVPEGHLVREVVISQIHPEMLADLRDRGRFGPRVGRDRGDRGATG